VCGSGVNRFRSSPQRGGVALCVGDIPSSRSDDWEERELCPGRLDPWWKEEAEEEKGWVASSSRRPSCDN
jgi:hypothetical protein